MANDAVIKEVIGYHSDFAMLMHNEVRVQSNCETTAPKSETLVKINMEIRQFHLKSEIVLIGIFTSSPF